MTVTFRDRYETAADTNSSLLCVGLDPDTSLIPPNMGVMDFLCEIVDATADLVCCYKPNTAFFESRGSVGYAELEALIAYIPDEVPVLLDAKRGDVEHSARHYAHAAFAQLGAHAITVNPYLGRESVEPFLAWTDRHTFVLCHTSNKGAWLFQSFGEVPHELYEEVIHEVREWGSNAGLVIGAKHFHVMRTARRLCPDMLFLVPGVGVQGGRADYAVSESVDAHGGGIIVNASRSVLYASADDAGGAARREAMRLRDAINAVR